ncbi:proteinase inhibitor I78 [Streptomyces sp. LX-29]|uniref:I78 family peptidase inhibitor n=1 Tax=Streptomyces sp. LX-29 TaxID=2900152 RepID=UPI00240D1E36|nr:I78 family peptidase inhibitor [Streptomyces sp. LX-29]WFB10278.1 proteinase inhibitor I78 [Streptomyces sp. LX-29]
MAPIPRPVPEPDDTVDRYVGMDAETAAEVARERGWSTVRAVPPGALLTMEYLSGRLNLEVADGVVRRSWKG